MAAVPDLARLRQGLLAPSQAGDAVDAAVMACLREGDGGVEVLLCRRARRSDDPWSGHIALPGGRLAAEDEDALAAARRETREEVGFDPLQHGTLLGALEPLRPPPPLVTLAAFVVEIQAPVAVRLDAEIDQAWWTPFHALEAVVVPVPEVGRSVEGWRLPFVDAGDVVVWGITYRLLGEVLRVAGAPAGVVETG
jgi:8-oxo-dGTP pyrophosphatase MutT (NUDIX family)